MSHDHFEPTERDIAFARRTIIATAGSTSPEGLGAAAQAATAAAVETAVAALERRDVKAACGALRRARAADAALHRLAGGTTARQTEEWLRAGRGAVPA